MYVGIYDGEEKGLAKVPPPIISLPTSMSKVIQKFSILQKGQILAGVLCTTFAFC